MSHGFPSTSGRWDDNLFVSSVQAALAHLRVGLARALAHLQHARFKWRDTTMPCPCFTRLPFTLSALHLNIDNTTCKSIHGHQHIAPLGVFLIFSTKSSPQAQLRLSAGSLLQAVLRRMYNCLYTTVLKLVQGTCGQYRT